MGAETTVHIQSINYLRPEQYAAGEQVILSKFFGKEIIVSPPPQELTDAMLKAREIGWTQAEAHFLPNIKFEKNSNFPGWIIKPSDWFWERIKEKELEEETTSLNGVWVIVDGSQKPEYQTGSKMYENDPFLNLLKGLRESGKIKTEVPWLKDISWNSRFAISYDEIQDSVNPTIANLLGVESKQVRLPRAIESNFLSNLYHPEFGETYSWEWCQDKFADGLPLLWGRSNNGGLGTFDGTATIRHGKHIGFRPKIVFPNMIK